MNLDEMQVVQVSSRSHVLIYADLMSFVCGFVNFYGVGGWHFCDLVVSCSLRSQDSEGFI